MQQYHFTGHLSPLPPGVKLPLQLSGQVYLASDVDPVRESYQAAIDGIAYRDREITELRSLVKVLQRSNDRLRKKLDKCSGKGKSDV
jgi:hypothetical protein